MLQVLRTIRVRSLTFHTTVISCNMDAGGSTKGLHNYPQLTAPFKSGSTMDHLKEDLRIVMGIEQNNDNFVSSYREREYLDEYQVIDPLLLPMRTMKHSFLSGMIPLSKCKKLQGKYLSNTGIARYGRLCEDMDIFAVMVLQKYIFNPRVPINTPSPYTVVTVLMDSMLMTNFTPKHCTDVRISGHIANVGRTSAEVIVWLDQLHQSKWHIIARARFIMAARNATNKKGAPINPLVAKTGPEELIIKQAKETRRRVKDKSEAALTKTIPTFKEQALLHQLFKKKCRSCLHLPELLPSGQKWISSTTVSNTVLSFPENKNMHNTIFGGYIMRKAIELAFSTCYIFAKERAKLRAINEAQFNRAIPIGAVIQMHSQIAYTSGRFMQVAIHANALSLIEGEKHATNTFQFTFEMPNPVHEVFPRTYHEAMQFITASRHLQQTLELLKEPFQHIDFNQPTENVKI